RHVSLDCLRVDRHDDARLALRMPHGTRPVNATRALRLRQDAERCNQEPMVDIDMQDGIALVRFARPPANAIELESARALEAALARLEADASVRALVITGQGGFFSAGLDLKVVPTYDADQQAAMIM